MARKINKKDISKILEQWAKEFSVLVPSNENGTSRMTKWNGKDTAFLADYRNTTVPPKDIILPMMEKLYGYKKEKDGVCLDVPEPDKEKKLVFGIRPCDARAMALLDLTFNDAYEDTYYTNKRKNTMLVGIGCTRPYDSCFCTSLGSSPTEAKNMDIMFIDIGEDFIIEGVSEKGKELVAKTAGLSDAAQNDEARAVEARQTAFMKVTRQVDVKDSDKKLLASFEDKEFWERVAAKCVSCGVCTFLCPTCYCFDMNDEAYKHEGTKYRCWDSCQFSVYTRMPMENPREEKWRRVRQKVCHKFEFYPMNYNDISCSGCGRCIRLCPVNWDITQVLNSLQNLPDKANVESK